jgi:hypothetical protein
MYVHHDITTKVSVQIVMYGGPEGPAAQTKFYCKTKHELAVYKIKHYKQKLNNANNKPHATNKNRARYKI